MFTIKTDDLTHPAVQALVAYHISGMLQQSPPESSHALDVQKLRNPTVTFWSVWEGEQLAGIGALKLLDDKHGELKSMRTAPNYLRRGVASLILRHILPCLLYTSDAADDLLCVVLGCRRIIKKKKKA